jgi:hypothetical protein
MLGLRARRPWCLPRQSQMARATISLQPGERWQQQLQYWCSGRGRMVGTARYDYSGRDGGPPITGPGLLPIQTRRPIPTRLLSDDNNSSYDDTSSNDTGGGASTAVATTAVPGSKPPFQRAAKAPVPVEWSSCRAKAAELAAWCCVAMFFPHTPSVVPVLKPRFAPARLPRRRSMPGSSWPLAYHTAISSHRAHARGSGNCCAAPATG